MLRKLSELVRLYRWHWRADRSYRRWLAQYPGGSFGQFYAHDARERIARAGGNGSANPPRTLGSGIDPIRARTRAESLLAYVKWLGCRPHHLTVDFGCGSLWVGEVLMRYLDAGRYVGMDVVDYFYTEALERLGPSLISQRQPRFAVISPDSLARERSRNPDFIISTAVLQHVRPRDLSGYFAQLVSLCAPSTRVIIGHKPHDRTRITGVASLQHSREAIRTALDEFGYEPRFVRPPGSPGCQIALFEIAPKAGAGGHKH